MAQSLYERLGGTDSINRIASNLVDRHIANPKIGARFAGSDIVTVKRHAADFFITGSGGPEVYTGKSMLDAHRHMNISDEEFMAAVDDVMAALSDEGIGDAEKAEVLFIFYSLRPEVVRV